jgi:hypothetical protein
LSLTSLSRAASLSEYLQDDSSPVPSLAIAGMSPTQVSLILLEEPSLVFIARNTATTKEQGPGSFLNQSLPRGSEKLSCNTTLLGDSFTNLGIWVAEAVCGPTVLESAGLSVDKITDVQPGSKHWEWLFGRSGPRSPDG